MAASEPRNGVEPDGVFGVLPERQATWAIGAVHGDAARLTALHRVLFTRAAADDNLVYLGNFLGRGGSVLETVQELLLFRRLILSRHADGSGGTIVHLRGRQEEMWHKLLQVQFAPNPRQVLEWMLDNGAAATLEAYGSSIAEGRKAATNGPLHLARWTGRLRAAMQVFDGHQQLMSTLKRAAFTADHALLLVSTGIDPVRPLSAQSDSFWWDERGFDAIDRRYQGFGRVVRGFDPLHRGLVITDERVSLDGGCGFGGSLFAARFDAIGDIVDLIEA